MKNPFSLEGKNIVITGASSGIGRQCAITCSLLGANLVLIARNEDRLKETHSQLEKGNHLIFSHDISRYDKLEEIIRQSVGQLGKISGFVHSAGILLTIPVKSMKPHHYEKLFSVNIISGFEFARILSKKEYLNNEGASYVFISSIMGAFGEKALVGYCSSKGALISGSKAMALEFVSKKIRVNCILPGQLEETIMTNELFNSISEEVRQSIKDMHPLGLGKPEDVANSCAFLLSDASRWITGINLVIDGGYSAR